MGRLLTVARPPARSGTERAGGEAGLFGGSSGAALALLAASAGLLPAGEAQFLDGQPHNADAAVLAPVLRAFFRG